MQQQTENLPTTSEQSATKKSRRSYLNLLFSLLALLVSIVVSAELTLYYRDMHIFFEKMNNKIKFLHAQDQILSSQVNLLTAQAQHTQTQLAALQQLDTGNNKAWVFAEVNYLVRLANYNLLFTRDLTAAIALLQTADHRLILLDDPVFADLRQQLADAIARLQAVPKVDIEGILVQLNALAEQSKQLPLVAPPSFVKHAADEDKAIDKENGWHRALKNSLNILQTLIVIRHHNQPISPLLAPEQQLYLQQNLQLILQQAQWAALHGQIVIYQNSLQQAKNWVEQYYAQDAAATRAFRHALDELQKIDIQPKLPDMTALMQSVQQTANQVRVTETN